MGKIDLNQLTDDIKDHLTSQVVADGTSDQYHLTRGFSTKIMGKIPVSVLVRFIGDSPDEGASQTNSSITRDLIFGLFFICQGEDDEACDILVNDAIMNFRYYCSQPQQGSPKFGNTLVEKAKPGNVQKQLSKPGGIFGRMELLVRIMEV